MVTAVAEAVPVTIPDVAVAVPKLAAGVVFVIKVCAGAVVVAVATAVDVVLVDGDVGYASSIGSRLTVIIFSIQIEVP